MRSLRAVPAIATTCVFLMIGAATPRAQAAPSENAPPANPDRERAALLFRAGQDAFARQDYAVAARSFTHAHDLLPSGFTIYNAARAWDRVPDPAKAAAAYAEALQQADLSDAQRSHAQKRIAELDQFVVKEAGPAVPPPVVPVEPQATPTVAKPAPLVAQTAKEAPPKASSSNALGWIGATVGVGGLVATGVVGWVFLSKRSDFTDGGSTDRQLRSEAITWGKFTTAAIAVTALGAGIALWSFHTSVSPSSNIAIDVMPTGLNLRGAF